MTMWNIFILLTVLAIVTSDIYEVCIYPQWEGVHTLLTGTQEGDTPTFIQTTGRLHFDANNSRIAFFTSGQRSGEPFRRDYLFLYEKKHVYIIEEERCHAESLTNRFPQLCLPKDFNWTMWRTWYGEEKMGSQLWIFGYDGVQNNLKYSVQMDMENRVVATQQIIRNLYNVPFFQTTELVNTSKGIKNPDVFTLPPNCKTTELKGNFTTPASIYGMFLP